MTGHFFLVGPSAPPRDITVTHVGSHSFSASWEPPLPADRNGIIIYYHIGLRRNNSIDEPHVIFTSDSNASITISQILPFRVYFLTVSAVTTEQGPLSSPVMLQTLEDGEELLFIYLMNKMAAL